MPIHFLEDFGERSWFTNLQDPACERIEAILCVVRSVNGFVSDLNLDLNFDLNFVFKKIALDPHFQRKILFREMRIIFG